MIDETTLSLIDRYGLPLTALVVLVLFIWKWVLPKLDQAWNMYVGAANKPEVDIDRIFATDIEISNLLVEILRKTGAGWALVWQFHNGGTNLNGMPFLRLSATHEQAKVICENIAHLYQNIPTSLLIDGSGACDINKMRSQTLCMDGTNNSAIRGIMTAHKMSLVHLCSLKDSHGSLVGYLTVCYMDKDSITNEDCSMLEEFAERAQILLDISVRISAVKKRK
jgi:hypothetical protein